MRRKRPGQSQRTAFLNVRIEPELKRQLEEEADKEERTVTFLVTTFIRRGLGLWQTPGPQITQK